MKKKYLFGLLIALFTWASTPPAWAQGCGCDHIITPSTNPTFWGTSSRTMALPGQTICMMPGTYKFFRFYNVQGTAQQPITIKNCGGQVVINSDTLPSGNTSGIAFSNCKHVIFTGTGSPGIEYGVKVDKAASGAGVSINGLSTNFEIDHVEVISAYFSGIMAKTDPGCDPASWRENFTMYDVKIHHNYIHDLLGGEGIYAGNSFWGTGMQRTCNGQTITVFPHRIMGLHIYNNRFERTACESIQVGCAPDALVHDNLIIDSGQSPFANHQNNGLQIGGGAGGKYYNNVLINTAGVGMTIVGFSADLEVYNNLIVGTGMDAIFSDDRPGTVPNTRYRIVNNTIVNAGRDAIRLYSEFHNHEIYNNALISPTSGRYVVLLSNQIRTTQRNNFQGSVATAQFVDLLNADYRLAGTSPLRDAGIRVDTMGISLDLENLPRQQGSAVDIGAYEYLPAGALRRPATGVSSITAVGNQVPTAEHDGQVRVFPNPARSEVSLKMASGAIQEWALFGPGGRAVLQRRPRIPQSTARFSVAALPTGVYVVRVRTATGLHAARLVKQ
jgi:hypothetical protein